MEKYKLLRERLEVATDIELAVPEAATTTALERVHTRDYVIRVLDGRLSGSEVRRIGFPWSPELVARSRRSVGGTLCAGRAALTDGAAANLAGGTHHAFADHGEGFCIFNDVGVAVGALKAEGAVARVAVLDLDVHQGNGTAAMFAGDDKVFTLSVHGENNFPFRKEAGDLDIALPDGSDDDTYLSAVQTGVEAALANGADLVFFIAGADPFEGDRLGRLSVSKAGLAARDELVFEACARHGSPVAVVMSGGYAHDVHDAVDIHEATVRRAARSVA
jgi:acetoin utilization deacetylase AcuC-like enzyme